MEINLRCTLLLPRVEMWEVLFLLTVMHYALTERIQNASDAGTADKLLKIIK